MHRPAKANCFLLRDDSCRPTSFSAELARIWVAYPDLPATAVTVFPARWVVPRPSCSILNSQFSLPHPPISHARPGSDHALCSIGGEPPRRLRAPGASLGALAFRCPSFWRSDMLVFRHPGVLAFSRFRVSAFLSRPNAKDVQNHSPHEVRLASVRCNLASPKHLRSFAGFRKCAQLGATCAKDCPKPHKTRAHRPLAAIIPTSRAHARPACASGSGAEPAHWWRS